MSLERIVKKRSNSSCELCGSTEELRIYNVPPIQDNRKENGVLYGCNTCLEQIENNSSIDPNHWRCLNDSMWSEVPAVKVIAWRMLHRLKEEGWPQDLLDMIYLEEDLLAWAAATGEGENEDDKVVHKDANGNILSDGDSVVLIKDLVVKGANFTAKRGTAVHRISLVWDNAEQIEGRVEGQQIVILTQYVKKTK